MSGYNTKSDIYSLAVTLCELANGVNPFVGCEKAQVSGNYFLSETCWKHFKGHDFEITLNSTLNSAVFFPA